MGRITTGIFNPKGRKLSFLTMMICLECGHLFESSRTNCLCPRCADGATFPAANWSPAKYGIPKLTLGKVGHNE